MHAWRAFVQGHLDAHQIGAAELSRRSGVSKQVLSKILNDDRDQLVQRPDQSTVSKLARAMGVRPDVLLAKVAEAMGLPVTEVRVTDPDSISNADLIRVLSDRLRRAEELMGNAQHPAPMTTDAPEATATGEYDLAAYTSDGEPVVIESKTPMTTQHHPGSGKSASVAAALSGRQVATAREKARSLVADASTAPDHEGATPNDAGDDVPPPFGLAARKVGAPSRGEQLRAQHDQAGEQPDAPAPEEG